MDKQVIRLSVLQIPKSNTIWRESEEAGLVIDFSGILEEQRKRIEVIFKGSKFGDFRVSRQSDYRKYFAASEVPMIRRALNYLAKGGALFELEEKTVTTKSVMEVIKQQMLEAEMAWSKDRQVDHSAGT